MVAASPFPRALRVNFIIAALHAAKGEAVQLTSWIASALIAPRDDDENIFYIVC
jgi:hypothetical protein